MTSTPCRRRDAGAKLAGAILGTLLATTLTGCASITKGSAQTIAVNTDPSGAACTLTRDGQVIGEINPTPSTVSVYKSGKPIIVTCRMAGYADSAARLGAGFEDMTLGNIIFGGLIGVFVDMGSGATHDYPTTISITLIPSSFPSTAARDAFFAQLKQRLTARTDQALKRIRHDCGGPDCDDQIKALEKLRDKRLQEIEKQRLQATVAQ
jgi:hypothetical protein